MNLGPWSGRFGNLNFMIAAILVGERCDLGGAKRAPT